MRNLKCPFCNYVWTPRVSRPRSCTRCKRTFYYDVEGRFPVETDEPVVQQRIVSPAVKKFETVKINCSRCGNLTNTVVMFKGKPYCPKCFLTRLKVDVPITDESTEDLDQYIARPEQFKMEEVEHE